MIKYILLSEQLKLLLTQDAEVSELADEQD